jgi:hypothetical protein
MELSKISCVEISFSSAAARRRWRERMKSLEKEDKKGARINEEI